MEAQLSSRSVGFFHTIRRAIVKQTKKARKALRKLQIRLTEKQASKNDLRRILDMLLILDHCSETARNDTAD
jgi:hypothetical protein